jgi:hypothetical protein
MSSPTQTASLPADALEAADGDAVAAGAVGLGGLPQAPSEGADTPI